MEMIFRSRPRLSRGGNDPGGLMPQPNRIGSFIALLPARPAAAIVIDPALRLQLIVGKKPK
jgi:hypothetical protein